MDNTVILFVSDHGEMLGDHLMFQKAKPFQGSIHVPLFISGRSVTSESAARFARTWLNCGMLCPRCWNWPGTPKSPKPWDGTSLLHPVEREYLHGEHTLGEDSMHFILTKEDK